MGAPIGSTNAKKYHQKRSSERIEAIQKALKEMKMAGLLVSNITALSKVVGEKTNIDASTLRRNIKYKNLLHQHLIRQGKIDLLMNEKAKEVELLKAKIISLKLQLSNVTADKKRFEVALSKSDEEKFVFQPQKEEGNHKIEELNIKFQTTAELLLNVMERVGGLKIDEEKGTIEDLGASPGDRQIASKEKSKWFIEYALKERIDEI